MERDSSRITARRYGDSIYIVENAVSDSAKENVSDKLKRLMLADAESLVKQKAS